MIEKNLTSTTQLDIIYKSVFRNSTKQTGFYYQDFGTKMDSKTFRQKMVELKNGLSKICNIRINKRPNYQGLGRFNQQHSSRLHRDSAQEHTFLMLGYEPTKVQSKVFIADYTKYIENHNLSIAAFFGGVQDVNTIENDSLLDSYITELKPFPKNHYRLVILNNSKSFKEKTFGVFHRGEILKKIKSGNRVLNYMMLRIGDENVEEQYDKQAIVFYKY